MILFSAFEETLHYTIFHQIKHQKLFLSSYFTIIEKSFSVSQLLKGLVAQLVKMSGRHLPLWENVHTISSKILHIRTLNIFLVLTCLKIK